MSEKILPGVNLLKEIIDLKPTYCIFTTYSLDLTFFEFELFDKLQEKSEDIRAVLLADRQSYRDIAASGRFVRNAEREYRFLPVDTPKGVFHPKVFLLGGDNWVRLYIGSANITRPGFTRNLEIIDSIACSADNQSNANCIFDACDFFNSLSRHGLISKKAHTELEAITNIAKKICHRTSDSPIAFESTITTTLAKSIEVNFPSDTREIIICSPFHDPGNKPIEFLAKKFPKAKFQLVVQCDESSFNFPTSKDLAKRISRVCFNKSVNERKLHAKSILAKGQNQSTLVTGSPNFTQAAFLNDWRNGNVEAWTVRKGDNTSFDNLFLNNWELVPAPKDIKYVPAIWTHHTSASPIKIDFASYDDGNLLLEIGIAGFLLKSGDSVQVLVESRLGTFRIYEPSPHGENLKLHVSPDHSEKLMYPASLTVFVKRGHDSFTSEPTFIELKSWLALDSSERRLRYTIAEIENSILSQGGTYDDRGLRDILKAVTDFIRTVASDGTQAPSSSAGEQPAPDDDAGWRRPGQHSSATNKVQLLGEMLNALRRISDTDPNSIRSIRKASQRTDSSGEDEPETATRPGRDTDSDEELWHPGQAFIRDFNGRFEEILEAIDSISASKPGHVHQILNALECLGHLSLLVNIFFIGLNENCPADEKDAAINRYDTHWQRITNFLFEEKTEECHTKRGWLTRAKIKYQEGTPTPAILTPLLTFLGKWAVDAKAKGLKFRTTMLRDHLGVIEETFGITPERFQALSPQIKALVDNLRNAVVGFPSSDDLTGQILSLYTQQRAKDSIQELLGPVNELSRLEILIAKNQDSNATENYRATHAKTLTRIKAKPELRDFLEAHEKAYIQQKKPVSVYFLDPSADYACPGCHMKMPLNLIGQLRIPTRMCICGNCKVILYGAAKFFKKGEPE